MATFYAGQSDYIEKLNELAVATGGTDLAVSLTSSSVIVTSNTGSDATISVADATNAGVLSAADKIKLNALSGINTGDQDLSGKQAVLISGTNIKSINGNSLLGSGDLTIGGGGGATNIAQGVNTTTTVLITSDTGGDATLVGANSTAAGIMISADKIKLDAITGTNTGDQTLGSLGAQAVLVSGTNIKTVNGNSLLGSGDISISGGATNISQGTNTSTTVVVLSDSGTDATLVGANSTAAGIMLSADKVKLDAITGTNTGDQDLSGKQDVLVSGTNIKTVNGNSLLGSGDISISGGATNISQGTNTSTTVVVLSDSGTDATLVGANSTAAGIMLSADKVKLDAITGTNTGDQTLGSLGAQAVLVSGTNIKTINGNSLLGSGDITISGGATNLSQGTNTATTVVVLSDTGTDATLVGANSTAAGIMLSADKIKLDAATNINTASTLVYRDASGNFSAGTITANLTGTASTVTTNANLTGEVTSSGNATTITNSAVIGKVLTGYVSGAGTVAATDTILQAIQKLNGNIAAGGTTNIAQSTRTGTTVLVTSSTGTSATLTVSDATNAGVMSAADKVKLDGIATGATVGITGANPTLTGYTETVYALSGTTPAFAEANGSIQTWALSANSAPTDSLTTGQSITLVITPGAYSVTWPTGTWTKVGGGGAAPTLYSAGKTIVVLSKIGSTLYYSHLGDA
jgi:hypothetical protein